MNKFKVKDVKIISEKEYTEETHVKFVTELGLEDTTLERVIRVAEEANLDVMFVSEKDTPVVKLINYEKYKYNIAKQQKKQKANNKNKGEKEVRLGYKTGEYDIKIKIKKVEQMTKEGYSVKVRMQLKGRENSMIGRGKELMNSIKNQLMSNDVLITKDVYIEGNSICFTVGGKK